MLGAYEPSEDTGELVVDEAPHAAAEQAHTAPAGLGANRRDDEG